MMITLRNKEVKRVLAEHVLSYFYPEEYEDASTPLEALKSQIAYIINPTKKFNELNYKEKQKVPYAIEHMITGGKFLVYDYEIIDFLVSLGLTDRKGVPFTSKKYEKDTMDKYSSIILKVIIEMIND